MPDPEKTKVALLDPAKDYSHRFTEVVRYLEATGWKARVKGSHHIFIHPGVPVLLNLQPEKNGKAKGYQIRQVRQVLEKHRL
ncbi:MAG TPA: type II toxin-antitoxin system HicA family toxin [Opitutaceae bacterium]|nr:type II toxin-antitoxin system HicA family toxin [Opitutaceae bacterium]